jgi:hypothetical protein
MKLAFPIVSAIVLLALTPAIAKKPDKPECAAARPAVVAAVAASCDCDAVPNHGQYVRCAARVVKGMAGTDALARNCRGAMVSVFAKSTCGKPDHVACCLPKGCKVKKASTCEKLGGTADVAPFCADACVPGSPSGSFVD